MRKPLDDVLIRSTADPCADVDLPDDVAIQVYLIDRLLATGDYDWARDTLEGIRTTLCRTKMLTLRQQEAVTHIIVGRLKHDRVD